MNRLSPIIAGVIVVSLSACSGDDRDLPLLDNASGRADAIVPLVDRYEALTMASSSQSGEQPELENTPDGFRLTVDTQAWKSLPAESASLDGTPVVAGAVPTASSVAVGQSATTALTLLENADASAAAVVANARTALDKVVHQPLEEVLQGRRWATSVTVDLPGQKAAEVQLTVNWIGVGWALEARLGTSPDTLWLSGFLSADRAMGWWDVYERGQSTIPAGVVEWRNAAIGEAQLGLAKVSNDTAALRSGYAWSASEGSLEYQRAVDNRVSVLRFRADGSGSIRANGGDRQCWNGDLADAPCP